MGNIRVTLEVGGNTFETERGLTEIENISFANGTEFLLESEDVHEELDVAVSSVKAAYDDSITLKRPKIEEHDE